MQSNWQVEFFRGVALEFWRRVMTPEQTRTEVEFLERALRIAPGNQLLDVPCGNGRHALEFANRGLFDDGSGSERGIYHRSAWQVIGASAVDLW